MNLMLNKIIKTIFIYFIAIIQFYSKGTNNIVKGYAYRHKLQIGAYYTKTEFERNTIPEYNSSGFRRNFKAVDSRNINQNDYENILVDKYSLNSSFYKDSTCVITAATIIVDYYARKNNYTLDTYNIYEDILYNSIINDWYYIGVSMEKIGNVLTYAMSKYQSYTGITYSINEKKSNLMSNITNLVNNEDVALYVFFPYDYPHAMVVCGYVQFDVTLASGKNTKSNGIVVNDVINNYNPSISYSLNWYNETEINNPENDLANYCFIPEIEAVDGKDYLWTVK